MNFKLFLITLLTAGFIVSAIFYGILLLIGHRPVYEDINLFCVFWSCICGIFGIGYMIMSGRKLNL